MSTKPKRRLLSRLKFWVLLVLLLTGGLVSLYAMRQKKAEKKESAGAYHTIQRGEFLVSIVEGGSLEAVNEQVVYNELQGTARIIYIIPEGTYVKKGDLLVELDAGEAEDQLTQQQIQYENSLAKKVASENALIITKSTVESDISSAELDVQFAEMDLRKFESQERAQQLRNAEIEIITARESLKIAEEKLHWSELLTEKDFETKSNLDKDRLAVTNQKLALEKAESELLMLKEFDLDKLQAKYESTLEESRKELERVRKQGESKIAQAEADLRSAEATLDLNRSKLDKQKTQLQATKLYAPQDGLVVYASNANRYSNESLIEAGATVRQRQELVKIPDISEMKVSIKVHESHISMIREGLPAFVVLDSLPDQRFRGTISKVAILPDKQSSWANPNLKVYNTEIVVVDPLPDIKPGVSARAEIVVAQLQDVITVPIQAVTTRHGKQVCYVRSLTGPQPREVEVGLFNNRLIEIRSGLAPGDEILLAPPFDESAEFRDEIVEKDEKLEGLPKERPVPPANGAPREGKPKEGGDGAGPSAGVQGSSGEPGTGSAERGPGSGKRQGPRGERPPGQKETGAGTP